MNTPLPSQDKLFPDQKAIRVTVPVTPEVQAAFQRLAAASGMSTGKAMGEWLADTMEGALTMAEMLEKARRAPKQAVSEMHAYALGLADMTSELMETLRKGSGKGKTGAAVEPTGGGTAAAPVAPAPLPPLSNTGGKVHQDTEKAGETLMKTTVDWLKFRTTANPFETLSALLPAFGTVGELLTLGEPAKGKDGWQHRRSVILAGDQTLAQIDYGGESQRGWLRFDMSGTGCEWVQDWAAMAKALESLQAQLRRVDLALTTHDGSVTHDHVVKAHQDGLFCTGGRNPKRRDITGSDPRDGRTVYVGARDGAKYVRCYEKGSRC